MARNEDGGQNGDYRAYANKKKATRRHRPLSLYLVSARSTKEREKAELPLSVISNKPRRGASKRRLHTATTRADLPGSERVFSRRPRL